MNRILSVETSRNGVLASEFVTKRLCCSFILTVAFLALVGGYLLGQFTTDRTAFKVRASYQDINKKIVSLSVLLKSAFHQNCSFTTIVNETVLASQNTFLDEAIRCLQNG
ncbi:uncharacterized protein LOC109604738 [Aethina tumida]|uniref:uncharacterized protein LOC109604738 n=1 Tax=Aethina tumida TaxID=116153 RepID=UPI00096AF732|nr:uncharacterized protein LOC109604738 [Aethina tumida]